MRWKKFVLYYLKNFYVDCKQYYHLPTSIRLELGDYSWVVAARFKNSRIWHEIILLNLLSTSLADKYVGEFSCFLPICFSWNSSQLFLIGPIGPFVWLNKRIMSSVVWKHEKSFLSKANVNDFQVPEFKKVYVSLVFFLLSS